MDKNTSISIGPFFYQVQNVVDHCTLSTLSTLSKIKLQTTEICCYFFNSNIE